MNAIEAYMEHGPYTLERSRALALAKKRCPSAFLSGCTFNTLFEDDWVTVCFEVCNDQGEREPDVYVDVYLADRRRSIVR